MHALLYLTLLWRWPLSYRQQSIDLLRKSMEWLLYHNGLRHERVKVDKYPNSLLTNISYIYPTFATNLLYRLHGQSSHLHNFIFAFKISSDEESFIAMGTLCHNWLAWSAIFILSTPKLTVDFQSIANIASML